MDMLINSRGVSFHNVSYHHFEYLSFICQFYLRKDEIFKKYCKEYLKNKIFKKWNS